MGVGCSKWIIESQAFMPPKSTYGETLEFKNSQVKVQYCTSKRFCNQVAYVLMRPTLPEPETKIPTLLFSHGNSSNLANVVPLLFLFVDILGVNVVAYDYSGYGRSSGYATEDAVYDNIDSLIPELAEVHGIPETELVLFGKSLGSAPSIHAASKFSVAGLIVESGFISCLSVPLNFKFVESLKPYDVFHNLDKIKEVKCEQLIIHGKLDRIVPFHHAETLTTHDHPNRTLAYFEDAGHCDILIKNPEKYFNTLQVFFKSLRGFTS